MTGLTVGTFYHFRVVATNSAGTTNGADQTFQAGPGAWTPFSRCAVDDPAMLATDGVSTDQLLRRLELDARQHQDRHLVSHDHREQQPAGRARGRYGRRHLHVHRAAPGGSLIADPATVTAGGVTVTATVESAGVPTDFDLLAGITVGMPIVTLPIKIHLVSQTAGIDLGPSCFIGSEMDPIVLHPANTDRRTRCCDFVSFDPDGTINANGILSSLIVNGTTQGDSTFSVPAVSGCGPNGDGSFDSTVNTVVGLPSPSGNNNLVLEDASSALAFPTSGLSGAGTIVTGQQFSDFWHLAFD